MTDTKKPRDNKGGNKLSGKFHYNPVNMSGRRAEVIDERVEEEAKELRREEAERAKPKSR